MKNRDKQPLQLKDKLRYGFLIASIILVFVIGSPYVVSALKGQDAIRIVFISKNGTDAFMFCETMKQGADRKSVV